MSNFDKIYDYIDSLEIIDTHEHLSPFENMRNVDTDVLSEYFSQYICVDLLNAGMIIDDFNAVCNIKLDIEERFCIAKPYWDLCQFTGYAQSLRHSVRLIYGIDNIDTNTIAQINSKFIAARSGGACYNNVLKNVCRIKHTVLDTNQKCDNVYFTPSVRLDEFIVVSIATIKKLEHLYNTKIRDFEDYLYCVRLHISALVKSGVNIFKCGLAYTRNLKFSITQKHCAEADFLNLLKQNNAEYSLEKTTLASTNLQNYMMHFIFKNAEEYSVTYQFHTGLQEGTDNYINNSNPEHLNNLFALYTGIKFDIFHVGYPYYAPLCALSKIYPNVYINMCWAHIISPNLCVYALGEWLELMPYNKICAFGGDYNFIDGVAGHQFIARKNVAKTLAKKIDDDLFDLDAAKHIAHRLFIDNAVQLYNLKT